MEEPLLDDVKACSITDDPINDPLLTVNDSIGGDDSNLSIGGVSANASFEVQSVTSSTMEKERSVTWPKKQAQHMKSQNTRSWTTASATSTQLSVQYDMVDIYLPRLTIGRPSIKSSEKTGTVFSGCINLSNTVLGAGILSLPYVVAHVGYGMAVILFILFALITFGSLHLTMSMTRCVHTASYYNFAEAINKPILKIIIDISVIIAMLSAGTSYLIIIGDVMSSFGTHFIPSTDHEDGSIFSIGNITVAQRTFWILLFVFILIGPASALKKMNALRHTSLFAMFCFAFITFVMVAYMALDEWDQCEDVPQGDECVGDVMAFLDLSKPANWLQFLEVTPFILLAFGCAQNTLPISNEMHNRTMMRLNYVLLNTLSFVVSIYLLVGISGYITYGDRVKPNILKLYPQNDYTALVRLCMALCVAFSYPLVVFPARRSLSTLLFKCDPRKLNNARFYGITYGFVLVTLIYAFCAGNIGIVFQISGSTAYPIKEYIFPAYVFLRMKHHKLEQDRFNDVKRKFAHVLFWFGILLIPFCLVMVFIDV